MMNKLAFFFPSNGPGGVQSIIIRLIKYAFEKELSFKVIDYEDGYVSSKIRCFSSEAYKKHVVIVDSLSECHFMSDYVFVAFNWQLSYAHLFERKFKTKFIYWDVHSTSLKHLFDISLFGYCFFKLPTEKFISLLVSESRVLTIDEVSKRLLQEISTSDNITVTGIPITLHSNDHEFYLPKVDEGLNVVYIGRAVDWKVIPFIYALSKLILQYPNFKINCNVYTDSKIDFIKLLPELHVNLNCYIEFHEGCSMSEIIQREKNRVNLSIGMGTSQFELMIFGVPTLLIPAVTESDFLSEFSPIWNHLLPPYIFGFDESSVSSFQCIDIPNNISLDDAGFIWSPDQLETVKEAALNALDLYSSESVCNILLSKSESASSDSSRAFNNLYFKFFLLWSSVVQLFKKIIKRG